LNHLIVIVGVPLIERHLADIVKKPSNKGGFWMNRFEATCEKFGCNCTGYVVVPEVTNLKKSAVFHPKGIHDQDRKGDNANGFASKKDGSAAQAFDPSRLSKMCRISDPQNFGCQCLIGGQKRRNLFKAVVRIFGNLGQSDCYRRKGCALC